MIFNFFKSKPCLRELIPEGFVDIHSHILPGIDDGAKDIEESLDIISKMKSLGFSKIIATPHTYPGLHENTNETIKASYDKLIHQLNLDIKIEFASEYMTDVSILEKIKNNSLLCINNDSILIETGFISFPNILYELIFELKVNGYTPIIAHPERYQYLFNNLKDVIKLKKMGCKFQINLLSLVGYYGKDVVKSSNILLSNEFIDYVGSDIHNIKQMNAFSKKVVTGNIDKIKKCIENNKITF